MAMIINKNSYSVSDNPALLYRQKVDGVELSSSFAGVRVGIRMSAPAAGSATAAFRFETDSGISNQTSGTFAMTQKIAIINAAGETRYIQAGTIT